MKRKIALRASGANYDVSIVHLFPIDGIHSSKFQVCDIVSVFTND